MLKPDQVRKTSLHKQEEVCVCVCARVHTRACTTPLPHVDISVNLFHTCLQTIHHVSSRVLDKAES